LTLTQRRWNEKSKDAIKTLNGAVESEKSHAALFDEALKNINNWKEAKTLYVCDICGYTVLNITFDKCPVCFNPKDNFIEIK